MEKQSEYYTPSIEEFHVGFEYYVNDLHDNLKDRTWRQQTAEPQDFDTIRVWLKMGLIYVKYLDSQDIQELGWDFAFDSYVLKPDGEYVPDRFELHQIYDGQILIKQITKTPQDTEIIDIFRGKCYNKSELKWIMDRLDIKTEKEE